MIRSLSLLAALALAACSSSSEAPTAPPCPAVDGGPALELDAGGDSSPADAAPLEEALRVDSLSPSELPARRLEGGSRVVVLRGAGFSRVTDVQVNVMSVPFTVVSDGLLVFEGPELELEELPAVLAVDVIVRPADQVQAAITYR